MNSWSKKKERTGAKAKFEVGLGWRYGVILSIVLIAFGWGWDAWRLASASAELSASKFVLATFLILPLTVAVALLASYAHSSVLFKWITWSVWGILVSLIAFHLPFEGMRLIAGLIDPTVRGLPIFPFTSAVQILSGFTAFVGALAGLPAALLQILATEWAWDRSSSENRLTVGGWLSLCVCVPLGLGLAFIYDYMANATLRAPIEMTNRVIQVALTTPPDLDIRAMSTRQMLEYEAGMPWRGRISARFVQFLADYDPETLQQLTVDVVFDEGLTLRCQTNQYGEVMAGCFDLGSDYRDALAEFVRTGTASCNNCTIRIQAEAEAWQAQHRSELSDPQQISVVHHSGGVATVRAELGGGKALACVLTGAAPVLLQECSLSK